MTFSQAPFHQNFSVTMSTRTNLQVATSGMFTFSMAVGVQVGGRRARRRRTGGAVVPVVTSTQVSRDVEGEGRGDPGIAICQPLSSDDLGSNIAARFPEHSGLRS